MDLLWIVTGVVLLYLGGESLLTGSIQLARRFGLSPLVTGLTVVAFGTSAPELAASGTAALQGSPEIAFGNVVGSNIANLGLILGLTALIRPLSTHSRFLRREVPVMLGATLLATALLGDGRLGRLEGGLLLALIVVYVVYLLRGGVEPQEVQQEFAAEYGGASPHLPSALLRTALGLALLLAGAHALVEGATGVARSFGVPERVIGLTVVAVGTSLPELASSLVAALKREGDVVLGNLVGSNIFNLLSILGCTALLRPLAVEIGAAVADLLVMLALSFLAWLLLSTGRELRRAEGGMLLVFYTSYLVWLAQ
jgi:cation:H+ antiporter